MLFSYRHPDHIASTTGHTESSKLSEHEAAELRERRRFIRSIPVPAVIECDEAEAWDLWNQVTQGASL
jgi:hypothetical protein